MEIPPRRRPVRAEVRIGPLTIPYQRAGAGPVVLLLRAERRGSDPIWVALHATLVQHARVVTPELPPKGIHQDQATWLADFLDGIGVTSAAAVADALAAGWVLQFARDTARIEAVAIITPSGGPSHPPPLGGSDRAGDGRPSAVLTVADDEPAVSDRVAAFLALRTPSGE